MAGVTKDYYKGAAAATPGNGLPAFAPIDRDGSAYVKDVYYYGADNYRHSLTQTVGQNNTTLTVSTTLTLAQCSGTYILNHASVAVTATLPDPTHATTDGKVVTFICAQNVAHIVRAVSSSKLQDSGGTKTTMTGAADGALLQLIGAGGTWKQVVNYSYTS